MHELDRDMAGVRASRRGAAEGDQRPAAGEALGHPVAETGERLRLGGEEALARIDALAQQLVKPRGYLAGERGLPHPAATAPSRAASRTSHSRQVSIPSPVRALTRIVSTSGWTWSML